jgi:type IV pilus assembly protein PilV
MTDLIFHRALRFRGCQSGVGLIEVLVAVLVLSIGFLGVAALQAMSLSTNNGAMARSMATISSYSVLDAMRIDRDAAEKGDYNGTAKADSCPSSTTTLAQSQLAAWCGQLAAHLGSAASTTGTIECDANGNCAVTISFDDSHAGNGGGAQTITTEAKL